MYLNHASRGQPEHEVHDMNPATVDGRISVDLPSPAIENLVNTTVVVITIEEKKLTQRTGVD